MFTPEQIEALEAPLHKSNVKKNPRGYDYVEGWHAIAEANRIFGFDAWHRDTVDLRETNRDLVTLKASDGGSYQQWRVGYLCKVRIRVGDVVRDGTGYGSGMAKPEALGDAIESAAKEAETDAMKRALMTFGNPFGLALYDKAKANVTDAPPESVAVNAARVAIGLCKTVADLTKWHADNSAMIDTLDPADKAAIRNVYGMRLEAVKPKAVANA